MTHSSVAELQLILGSARLEVSPIKAKHGLQKVATIAGELNRANPALPEFPTLRSTALAELAALELDSAKRLALRRQAISSARLGLKSAGTPELHATVANRVVDHFHDVFAREESLAMSKLLAETARDVAKVAADPTLAKTTRAVLLCQRSSILRCQAMTSKPQEQLAKAQEAVRCAQLAVNESAGPYTFLELGQALWNSARWTQNDEDYFRALQNAEAALLTAAATHEPSTKLVLARFYRQSYRPAQAVDAFRSYAAIERTNRRRLLAEAFLLGEASMQVWYNRYETSFVESALEESETALTEAVAAGYETARHLASLAFVQAALGRASSADATLNRLSPEAPSSWIAAMAEVETSVDSDSSPALFTAFAIGVDQGSLWNSLGTYAGRFMRDDNLALRFYRFAQRLEPHNAVILTNTARVALRLGGAANIALAEESLRSAARYAPRSFVWWRALQDELATVLGRSNVQSLPNPSGKLSFSGLQKQFKQLLESVESNSIEPQRRGYEFQRIVQELLTLTFRAGDVARSHRVVGRQVDAAFTYEGARHRVEIKWEKRPLTQDQLDSLAYILEQSETRGVVVSMTGFVPEAIEAARRFGLKRPVVLVDGDELRLVFAGRVRFEALLEWKMLHWKRNGEPYARWSLNSPDVD